MSAREVTTVVATANIPVRSMSPDEVRAALRTVLAEHPHYVGLQEVGPGADRLLSEARRYGRARAKGGPPILFDLDRTGLLHVRPRRLAGREYVGHLPGRKNRLPASIATEAVLEDDVLGEGRVICAHLTAEVQSGGRYRRDAAHRLRVMRHKRERRRLRRLARRSGRRGWVVVVLDSNFDGFTLPPLKSCWDGRKGGTLGSRAVDVILTPWSARRVHTIATGSDHRAVVAVYGD